MSQRTTQIIQFILLSILMASVIVVVYIGSVPQRYNLDLGSVSRFDIVAPRTVADTYETKIRAMSAEQSVDPIYMRSEDATDEAITRVNQFFVLCKSIRDENITEDGTYLESYRELSNQLIESATRNFGISLTDDEAFQLITGDASQFEYLQSRSISLASLIMAENVDDQRLAEQIDERIPQVRNTDDSFYISNQDLIRSLLGQLLIPNAIIDLYATESAQIAAYEAIMRNPVMIEKGSRIISLDQVIDEHAYSMLDDLDLLERQGFDYVLIAGIFTYMLVIFTVTALYIVRFESDILSRPKDLIAISVAFLIPIVASVYLVDVSPLLSTIYFTTVIVATYLGIQSGIIISLVQLLIIFPINRFEPEFVFVSVVGIFVCSVIAGQKRRKFNSSSLILFSSLACLVASIAYNLIIKTNRVDMFQASLWAVISATISVVVAIGSMPIFELISNTVSPVRLIDLSQPGHPLLKRLFLEAPGTSQHSMMVANLADSAADAIGADALLAKVGAYYHDIGKLDSPEYFTENQSEGVNPHDKLAPTDSSKIITSHPDNGIRLARKNRLPNSIIRIIQEHHGTTVQTYFYHKAKTLANNSGQADPALDDYQYKGAIPSSRESAVVMLADTCEAALRSTGITKLDEAEVLFRKLIKQKIDQDQLIASGLSFSDIEKIIRAFLQVYAGYFHERIKYPDDNSVRKQAAQG